MEEFESCVKARMLLEFVETNGAELLMAEGLLGLLLLLMMSTELDRLLEAPDSIPAPV